MAAPRPESIADQVVAKKKKRLTADEPRVPTGGGINTNYGPQLPDDRIWQEKLRDGGNAAINYALGPHAQSVMGVSQFSDAADMQDAAANNLDLSRAVREGRWGDAAKAAPWAGISSLAAVIPGISAGPLDNAAKEATSIADETAKPVKKAGKAAKQAPTRMTQLPNLREMPVADATKLARKEPHLMPSPDRSEGMFIGGPRAIQDRKDLLKVRRELDATVARDPRGGDWYDRTRGGFNEITGGDQNKNLWKANKHGQFSAGVDPGSELHFTIKDTNSAIATGTPVKAARPAQQQATARALEAKDPTKFQLGKKTGEYARRINPDQPGPATATGVNDFRHARNLGFTEPDGSPQRNAIGSASHTYADYETALAVDRANKKQLAGRNNWTGEQLQAAPWVTQKGDDLFSRQSAGYRKRATADLIARGSNASPEEVETLAREYAFNDANRTITDFFPKHTANATYEAQPGPMTNHLPGSRNAPDAERQAFANDPRSSWNTAPGGRDAIYNGYDVPGTGDAMGVRPTIESQGVYKPPGGPTEYNPANVARPLVTFDSGKVKTITPHDRALLDGAEATRAYVDAQGAGAWHKGWTGGAPGQSNSVSLTKNAAGRLDPAELARLQAIGQKYKMPDVTDYGTGVTITDFENGPGKRSPKQQRSLEAEIQQGGGYSAVERSKVDSGYIGYESNWPKQNSGAVTQQLLTKLNELPAGVRESLDRNPDIPMAALARMERDAEWSARWGATREDIQNARRIISEGPGWQGRLAEAIRRRAVLPAILPIAIAASVPALAGEEERGGQ